MLWRAGLTPAGKCGPGHRRESGNRSSTRKGCPWTGAAAASSTGTVRTASAPSRTSVRQLRSLFTGSWSRLPILAAASEKGEAWYKGGFKTTKPNTWKDFIAAAEYLVQKGYTSKEKLAGTGTSAGGILISRAITERPDLFGAAVCNVGWANMMRTEFSPNGPVNTPEFGTVNDPVEAQALYEMDGVQHVQQGVRYPAVLGVGGWNDPRVSPGSPGNSWRPSRLRARPTSPCSSRSTTTTATSPRRGGGVQELRGPVRLHALADGPQRFPARDADAGPVNGGRSRMSGRAPRAHRPAPLFLPYPRTPPSSSANALSHACRSLRFVGATASPRSAAALALSASVR